MAVIVLSALAGVASAQPAPPPPPEAPPPEAPPPEAAPPQETPPPAGPEPRVDAGWQLYHEAFSHLLAGKRRRAAQLVTQLQREHPGHPAMQLTTGTSLVLASATDTQRARRELPSKGARAELALFQTVHGIVLGIELCGLIECDSGEAFIGTALLGGAAGAGVSLTQKNLTSGQRALINSGTVWGAANAGFLMGAVQPDDYKSVILVMMAGQLGGMGLGASMYALHPTAGQVGIANSGGQWGLALTGLTIAAVQPDNLDDDTLFSVLLVAMDAGLGVGAYIARTYPRIGRGRGWVIDASGIAGAVGGGGLGILVSGSADERATPGLAAAGAVIGLAAGAYLTRDWDSEPDDGPGVQAVVLPAAHGRGATAGIALQW